MQHLRRYQHIGGVLVKYGLDELAVGLRQRVSWRALFRRPAAPETRTRPERFRLALQELGPTFIKLGQLLSTRPDLVGPDYIFELEKLQDQVPPVGFDLIRQQIELHLGRPLEQLFAQFDPVPVAAASIAQVHKAVLHSGEVVAVKIRRPGIAQTIRTECEILEGLSGVLGPAFSEAGDEMEPREFVHEFTEAVMKEVDLTNELSNLRQFARSFEKDPTVHIVKAYEPYCSQEVLTMEFIDGIKPTRPEVLQAAGLDCPLIARRGADFVLRQIFDFGFFHTDPHPGNLFILKDNVIAPIDFGQAARLTQTDRRLLGDFIMAIVDLDAGRLVRAFARADMVNSQTNHAHLQRDLEKLLEVYHSLPIGEIPFTEMASETFNLIRKHHVRPPVEFTMMLKSMMTIENLAISLDPAYRLIEQLRPFAHKINLEQLSPSRLLRGTMHAARDAADLAANLPDDVNVILDKIKQGLFQVHIQHEHLDDLVQTMDKSSNRISFSLVIAGLLVASSFLVPQDKVLLGILNLHTLGILGYVLATFLGLWLLIGIMRSRRL